MRRPDREVKWRRSKDSMRAGWAWLVARTASSSGMGAPWPAPCADSALTSLGRQLPPKPQPAHRKRGDGRRDALAVSQRRGEVAAPGARRASRRRRRCRRARVQRLRDLVGERDQRRQQRVRGVLDHLGGRVVGARAAGVVRERRVDLAQRRRCVRASMPPSTMRSGCMKSSTASPSVRNSGFMPDAEVGAGASCPRPASRIGRTTSSVVPGTTVLLTTTTW